MPASGLNTAATEQPELTDDMTRADLADVLEHLAWRRSKFCAVRLDRGVRDYLLRILRQR